MYLHSEREKCFAMHYNQHLLLYKNSHFEKAQCSYLLQVFSIKMLLFRSYFLWNILICSWSKLLLTLTILSNWGYWGYRIFNITLEEYKVIHLNWTSDYIKKDKFDGVQVILLCVKFWKKYKSLFFSKILF